MTPRGLIKKYEKLVNQHDFDLLAPHISSDCKFWFSSGTFVGLEQVRQAFEKTWGLIKNEIYCLSDLEWLVESDVAAVCTYTFHWKGWVDGQQQEGTGRGTSCFQKLAVSKHFIVQPRRRFRPNILRRLAHSRKQLPTFYEFLKEHQAEANFDSQDTESATLAG